MARILFTACMFATWAVAANCARSQLLAESPSPSPSASISKECSTLIYNMDSCLTFLSNGGNETKPDSACCSGFESVVKGNAECICEALRSSSDLGVKLNMSMAMALPSACGLSATPISECDISPPGASPGSPPKTPANPPAPVPTSGGELTPAPSTDTGNDQASAPTSGGELTPAPSTDTGNHAPAPSSGGELTPAPSTNTGNQSPAPSPVHGGAYSMSASFTVVIISMLVASFSINISV